MLFTSSGISAVCALRLLHGVEEEVLSPLVHVALVPHANLLRNVA